MIDNLVGSILQKNKEVWDRSLQKERTVSCLYLVYSQKTLINKDIMVGMYSVDNNSECSRFFPNYNDLIFTEEEFASIVEDNNVEYEIVFDNNEESVGG